MHTTIAKSTGVFFLSVKHSLNHRYLRIPNQRQMINMIPLTAFLLCLSPALINACEPKLEMYSQVREVTTTETYRIKDSNTEDNPTATIHTIEKFRKTIHTSSESLCECSSKSTDSVDLGSILHTKALESYNVTKDTLKSAYEMTTSAFSTERPAHTR